jgi:hypothetical protein
MKAGQFYTCTQSVREPDTLPWQRVFATRLPGRRVSGKQSFRSINGIECSGANPGRRGLYDNGE